MPVQSLTYTELHNLITWLHVAREVSREESAKIAAMLERLRAAQVNLIAQEHRKEAA